MSLLELCVSIVPTAGAFAVFFNRVWEKKSESEEAYEEHLASQSLSDTLHHKKHRPLPEVPPSPTARKANHRNRSLSERHHESPTLVTREIHGSSGSLNAAEHPPPFEVSLVDDVGPYAVVKRTSFPASLDASRPQFTSTPNASSAEEVNPYASSTPLRAEVR